MTRFKTLFPFFFLYLAEGAPIGLIWWTLPTVLKNHGFETATIATLSATVVIPWSLKFLLGPIVDLYFRSPRKLKFWILFSQFMMALSLLPLITAFDSSMTLSTLTFYLVLHAIFAAGQDVGIDTLAIKTLPKNLLGLANGWMQGGMLTGRALIGGAGLWLALEYSPKLTISLVLLILILASFVIYRFKTESSHFDSERVSLGVYVSDLKLALMGKTFWMSLLLSYVVGFSFEGIGVVAGPLLRENEVSNNIISFFFGIGTPLSLSVAAILGGKRADRVGHKKGLTEALLGISAFVLVFLVFLNVKAHFMLIVSLLTVYFGIGWLTASLYALLMEISDKKLAAVQFSAFMAMTNLCESTAGFLMSWGIGRMGYTGSFLFLLSLSWFGFILLRKLSIKEIEKC